MYTTEVKLNDNESLFKMNKETGLVNEIKSSFQRNPDMGKFNESSKFVKTYDAAWRLLESMTTPIEYRIASRMASMAKMNTNSLEPLDDDYTYQQLADEFSISKTKSISCFKKLFSLGVYGKFEVYDAQYKHSKYWVFNPYLSSNGPVMSKSSVNLFSGTIFAKL